MRRVNQRRGILHAWTCSLLCLTITALGLSALLVTGCGSTEREATSAASTAGPQSPTAVATKKTEGGQDLGKLGSPHTPETATQNGFLLWVPKDWSIVHNDSASVFMVPNAFKDEWDPQGAPVSVAAWVFLDPVPPESPSEHYERRKSVTILDGRGSISEPQDVSWLGAAGLMWTAVDAGEFKEALIWLEGKNGFRVEFGYAAMTLALYDEYRKTVDSIFASIKRAE